MKTCLNICLLALPLWTLAQSGADTSLTLDIELRARSEWRDGYILTALPTDGGTLTTVQRSRVGLKGGWGRISFKVAFQDVRTHGATAGSMGAAEAWGGYAFTPELSLKVGRLFVDFDGGRMVGAADWANPGRFLDGFRLDRTREGSRTAFLITWNESASTRRTILHQQWKGEAHDLSLLLFDQSSSTEPDALSLGTTWIWNAGRDWSLRTEAHLQLHDGGGIGRLGAIEATRKSEGGTWKWGADVLSGGGTGSSFQPLLGTNHKFYGWMDHFYLGTATDGLMDLKWTRQTPLRGKRLESGITLHHFRTPDGRTLLGNEADLWFTGSEGKDIRWFVGWSLFDPTLAHVDRQGHLAPEGTIPAAEHLQQWGWVSLQIIPSIILQ